MEKVESRIKSTMVDSARAPILKNSILDILHGNDKGMDASEILQEISKDGMKLEYKGLLYKSLQMLVRSGKLERDYSPARRAIIYRLVKE